MPLDYIKDRKKCLKLLDDNVKGDRNVHSRHVEEQALRLAKRYGADEAQAGLAGLLHDITKQKNNEQLKHEFKVTSPVEKTLHGPTAAAWLRHNGYIEDPDVLSAIRYHTTGRAAMSLLEKIIYIADITAEGRDFEGVDTLRALAEKDLDEAVLWALDSSIKSLLERRSAIDPETVLAYNYYRRQKDEAERQLRIDNCAQPETPPASDEHPWRCAEADRPLDYTNDRQRCDALVRKYLGEQRYEHSLGVEQAAIDLAERYGADEDKAGLAGLLHDITKEMNNQEMMLEYGAASPFDDTLHARTAASWLLANKYVDDQDVLSAIRYHTTGRQSMNLLEKIIFVADAIEPTRDYPKVQKLRKTSKKDLDKAVYKVLRRTIKKLMKENSLIDPDTIHAYNYYWDLIMKIE